VGAVGVVTSDHSKWRLPLELEVETDDVGSVLSEERAVVTPFCCSSVCDGGDWINWERESRDVDDGGDDDDDAVEDE